LNGIHKKFLETTWVLVGQASKAETASGCPGHDLILFIDCRKVSVYFSMSKEI